MPLLADVLELARPRTRSRRAGWVGVDVGSAVVKLAEVELRGRSARLVRSLIIPRSVAAEPQSSDGAGDGSSNGLGDLLAQRLAASNPFARRTAACVLSMSLTPLRMLELPPGTPDELREMASQELTESAEEGGRHLSVGCWPAPSTGRDDLVPVYALAVDEEVAVAAAEDLFEARLRTRVLDGLPFALARGILLAEEHAPGPVAALDWGRSTATVVVGQNGQPVFARVLRDAGLSRMIEAVAGGFGVPEEDAERLLMELGLPDPRAKAPGQVQATLRELVAEPLNILIDELKRTLSFLGGQTVKLSPSRLWLFGGGATIINVAPWLAEATGLPVETWRLAGQDVRNATLPLLGAAAALSLLGCDA